MNATRIARGTLVALLGLMITGCNVVLVPHPMGETPVTLEAKDWDGTWLGIDGPLVAKVTDGKKGLMQIAWVEEENNGLKSEILDLHIRQTGSWIFASIKYTDVENPDEEWEGLYYWGRIKKDESQIILWFPDPNRFKTLVEKGKLPGRIEDDNVFLDALTSDTMKLITGTDDLGPLVWEEPIAFIRVGK